MWVWGTQRDLFRVDFCLRAAAQLYQFFKFLSFPVHQAFQCQLVSGPAPRVLHELTTGTAGLPGHHSSTGNHGSSTGYYWFCTSWHMFIFISIPGLAPLYFSFGPRIQHQSLIHPPHPFLPIFSCQLFPSPGHSQLCRRSKTFLLHRSGGSGSQQLHFTLITPAELSPLLPRWYSKCLLCGWQ